MEMDWKVATAVAIGLSSVIVLVSVTMFSSDPRLFSLLNGTAAFVALAVPVYVKYREYKRMKAVEDEFPRFIDDFTNNISVGMPLPSALAEAAGGNYGELTPYVQEMNAKVEWGVPFEYILKDFGEKTKSALIARTVRGVIQAHDSGGKLSDVMRSMSSAIRELDKVKKERSASVFSQTVTGYFVFFVFVGIMVIMSSFLIPLLSGEETGAIGVYQSIFLSMILVQGIFAGLGIGKMAEGSITAGLKHSFVLSVVGYTALAVA